jgi:hypothetical protein
MGGRISLNKDENTTTAINTRLNQQNLTNYDILVQHKTRNSIPLVHQPIQSKHIRSSSLREIQKESLYNTKNRSHFTAK